MNVEDFIKAIETVNNDNAVKTAKELAEISQKIVNITSNIRHCDGKAVIKSSEAEVISVLGPRLDKMELDMKRYIENDPMEFGKPSGNVDMDTIKVANMMMVREILSHINAYKDVINEINTIIKNGSVIIE